MNFEIIAVLAGTLRSMSWIRDVFPSYISNAGHNRQENKELPRPAMLTARRNPQMARLRRVMYLVRHSPARLFLSRCKRLRKERQE